VPEEDAEYHDATEEHKGNCCYTFYLYAQRATKNLWVVFSTNPS
jgi:hypothetical protein